MTPQAAHQWWDLLILVRTILPYIQSCTLELIEVVIIACTPLEACCMRSNEHNVTSPDLHTTLALRKNMAFPNSITALSSYVSSSSRGDGESETYAVSLSTQWLIAEGLLTTTGRVLSILFHRSTSRPGTNVILTPKATELTVGGTAWLCQWFIVVLASRRVEHSRFSFDFRTFGTKLMFLDIPGTLFPYSKHLPRSGTVSRWLSNGRAWKCLEGGSPLHDGRICLR